MRTALTVRLWIGLFALVCFLSGLATGVLMERRSDDPQGAFADFRERLAREFDLAPERERGLAMLLENYQIQLEELESRGLLGLEDELVDLGTQYNVWIRELVIPPSQWDRYDLMLGDAVAAAPQ
ncbi:hypothetical protein Pla163_35750 [Planctomycetes bacterium Pla163]|uniref:Uncharacterized protein n=1 Tax=Rohdeia mirabilis TaxID=2528008 RepID=A0A518D4N8_9BACT|nr:hypothetical protein Pla163_35750 [Planctomycetes bacterium Pla163]